MMWQSHQPPAMLDLLFHASRFVALRFMGAPAVPKCFCSRKYCARTQHRQVSAETRLCYR